MTPTDIVHQRRLAVVTHAIESGNISATSRLFGVSRTSIHNWIRVFEAYGSEGLKPKQRRQSVQPNATPTWVIDELLRLAVTEPGWGARRYADRLTDQGHDISRTTIQNLLNRHQMGRRSQRYAAAAKLALFTEGIITEASELKPTDSPYGFCLWAPAPAALIGLDCFYIGKLKGVGEVWQLTAVDTHSRTADVVITIGRPNATKTIRFVDMLIKRWRRRGYEIGAVLTDNGGEFIAHRFRDHLERLGITHRRIPPRSPNHNAIVERFHQTMLEDCWRPAFHRRRFDGRHQLQAHANAWLIDYNNRPNHGNWMKGRRPNDITTPKKTA